jgi:hypothetical protein
MSFGLGGADFLLLTRLLPIRRDNAVKEISSLNGSISA